MSNFVTFNKTVKGSSHDVSGKPCQDFSISETLDGGCILIVCDGHGGDTYVRSDVGSRLAASITQSKIKEFLDNLPRNLFFDKAGSLTALPSKNPLLGHNGQRVDFSALTESQQEIVLQAKSYLDSVKNIPEQKAAFTKLFEAIYSTWLEEIEQDSIQNPFSDVEKNALGNHSLTKAYGSTLMAYVQTKWFWFAFHIGDGKMLICDHEISWSEPVPWDCRCFLNLTTSLCDENPIPEFRFAFDGTGNFPAAVFLGSDGIDDSFVTSEYLRNFYTKTLGIFAESGDLSVTLSELEEYLPKLSKKASHDDMSIAGHINLDAIKEGLKLHLINVEGRDIKENRQRKSQEVEHLKSKLSTLREEEKRLRADLDELQTACKKGWWDAIKELLAKKENISDMIRSLSKVETEIAKLAPELDEKNKDLETWEPPNKSRYEELSKERGIIIASIKQSVEKEHALFLQERATQFPDVQPPLSSPFDVSSSQQSDDALNVDSDYQSFIDEEAKLQSEELLSAHSMPSSAAMPESCHEQIISIECTIITNK